jgi:hypothetical protein
MPERRGRKRKPERRRTHPRSPDDAPRPRAERPQPDAGPEPPYTTRPALRWRYAGFFLGVITLFFGVLTVAQGTASSGANALLLLVAGAFLVALALVLGALSVVPDRMRALFVRD